LPRRDNLTVEAVNFLSQQVGVLRVA
jgi:hypothetical protein